MTAAKLLIEHSTGKKTVRKFSVEPKADALVLIGSSRGANLRIVGEGVSPIHAAVEKRGPDWFVIDMGSSTGTWVFGESIVERKVTNHCQIRIGPHSISLTQAVAPREFFAKESQIAENLNHHQIVVKRGTKVLETHLLPKQKEFVYYDGHKDLVLNAPDSNKWKVTSVGKHSIYQRLVASQAKVESDTMKWIGPEMRKPLLMVTGGLFLLIMAAVLWPSAPTEKLNLAGPSEVKNVYEQMVFDAKLVKKKRDEAGKISAKKFNKKAEAAVAGNGGGLKGNGVPGGSGHPDGQTGGGGLASATGGSGQGVRLITNIRASGLNQLIGKIAKRSAKNVVQIGAGGPAVTADTVASGSAIAAIAGTQTAPNASVDKVATVAGVNFGAQNNNSGFRLGSVNTNGRGGGGTAKGLGLNTAAVGTGTGAGTGTGYGTGIGGGTGLDDEAEVSGGGLDKEVIAEVIKRDIGQIRYCYERQLSSSPDLYGKVVVKFGIGGDGNVELPKIGSSTLNNAMVEGCILRRAAKWKFPNPKGGTQVLVTYPFLFKSLK